MRSCLYIKRNIFILKSQNLYGVRDTIPTNMLNFDSYYENHLEWHETHIRTIYILSVFTKGPLLYISATNIGNATPSSLFFIKVYKESLNLMLLNQQTAGVSDECPSFLLFRIPGLRRSSKTHVTTEFYQA